MATSTAFGTALLPDIGRLAYRAVEWTCLYSSQISGQIVQDAAGRTTKYVKYTLTADGIVTLDRSARATSIDAQMVLLRQQLTQPAGILTYTAKGFGNPFVVNAPGRLYDVAWGPIPELLEFIPMGGSNSAMVKWKCTFCLPEIAPFTNVFNDQFSFKLPLLAFNFSSSVGYDADSYATITIKGSFEVAATRQVQTQRTIGYTADTYREAVLARITNGFPLYLYKVTERKFDVSLDLRTMDFTFVLKQLPPMGNPPGIMTASGEFSFKPEKPAVLRATISWLCTLRCTYVVPPGEMRRLAWVAFISLWRFRMIQSQQSGIVLEQPNAPGGGNVGGPGVGNAGGANVGPAGGAGGAANNPAFPQIGNPGAAGGATPAGFASVAPIPTQPVVDPVAQRRLYDWYAQNRITQRGTEQPVAGVGFNAATQKAIPVSLSGTEGLYEDSRSITFEAQWKLFSALSHILWSTGLWRRSGIEGGRLWQSSVRAISGPRASTRNQLNPAALAIVDFGESGPNVQQQAQQPGG
jgi:hypothetical protein